MSKLMLSVSKNMKDLEGNLKSVFSKIESRQKLLEQLGNCNNVNMGKNLNDINTKVIRKVAKDKNAAIKTELENFIDKFDEFVQIYNFESERLKNIFLSLDDIKNVSASWQSLSEAFENLKLEIDKFNQLYSKIKKLQGKTKDFKEVIDYFSKGCYTQWRKLIKDGVNSDDQNKIRQANVFLGKYITGKIKFDENKDVIILAKKIDE